jgi:protein-disulfide isomerase
VLTRSRLPLLLLAFTLLTTFGCHAQPAPAAAAAGKPVPPALAFRIEALLRRKADLPPASSVNLGRLMPSKMAGFSTVSVSFTNDGRTSHTIDFLVSDDGKTMEQVTSYDLSVDPREALSVAGRPSRGGPATAPVLIVGFDDLECPFCAKLHANIFPAITERYGDKVHIVYRDMPLDMHPWAMRAAVDVNCLAAQSPVGYWDAVDHIHAISSDIGADPKDAKADKTLVRATEQLDAAVREEGTKQKVDMTKLNACLAKQDTAEIEASKQLATSFSVQSTPTLFINGDKVDGAVPIEFVFSVIDSALRAEGVAPPPPYVVPAPAPMSPTKPVHGR